MNTPRRNRRMDQIPVALVAALLLILGILGPTAAAQPSAGDILASQFLGGITGQEAGYRLSPDAVFHTPEGIYAGHAGLVNFGDDLAVSFDHLDFSMEAAVQAGDLVIVSLAISGVNTGSYHGVAANCAGITVPAVAVLRLDEQRDVTGAPAEVVVVEQWIDYDRALIAGQISAVNLMDPGDRPGCADHVVTSVQDTNADGLPPMSPVPPVRGLPY